jgi:hypothetical protein
LKGGAQVTVLYGSVKYFERQISHYLAINQRQGNDLWQIYFKLENEILNDYFLCDENIQMQCIDNLITAVDTLTDKHSLG